MWQISTASFQMSVYNVCEVIFMAKASKEIVQAAVIGFGLPALILLLVLAAFLPKGEMKPTVTQQPTQQTETQGSITAVPSYRITVLADGETLELDLEEYVMGVLLAEMPASFHEEALKAQAVAARTYALKTCQDGKKHSGAICDSPLCCQGYMSQEAYLLRGWKEKYVLRVRQAVEETRGQVLLYENKLIRATYFSCSGGATESAVAVWGRDYPYLQSVKSPGEEETVYYTDTVSFTLDGFQDALGIRLDGTPETWFGSITYTSGGGIDTMYIGDIPYRGTTLRALLGLRSTVFQVIVSESGILFETRGFGHRVGMSQYGADAMAQSGADYGEILHHYYQGTELSDFGTIVKPG